MKPGFWYVLNEVSVKVRHSYRADQKPKINIYCNKQGQFSNKHLTMVVYIEFVHHE